MSTIKWIIAAVLLGTMASCNGGGFTMQSTKTVKSKEYQMESLRSELDEMKAMMQAEKDSLRADLLKKQAELNHYKDSVAFMELDRQACYTTTEHRHSCEIYK